SYLLIGFWFKNQDYNKAANKAFIMNRIGDLAMLFGLFLLFNYYGSLTYGEEFNNAKIYVPDTNTITAITILLFIGACGKSAQLPLYTWLPDAMAGPTPVSALIHAATMVTAGIYMIVRSNILFTLAPFTQEIIMVVGIATSIFAGTIALKQNDIKKVLAYSTVSQLGLMFFALGIGAYEAGFFHLVTHAFFKALLFLAAGSVIHGLNGEQDIRKMGGLSKHMKITHWVFGLGVLAICAVPPFSGFFSKDTILISAYEHHPVLWAIGLVSGLITAFYMMRLYFVVFRGEERFVVGGDTNHGHHGVHESPKVITIPLIILCVLAIVGGVINIPHLFGGDKMMMHYLSDVVPIHEHGNVSVSEEWILMGISTCAILAIIFVAFSKYYKRKDVPESDTELKGYGKVLNAKYYVDEIYDAAIVRPWNKLSAFFSNIFEKYVVDGAVNGSARLVQELSNNLRLLQVGTIGFYLFTMVIGVICLLVYKMFM
ncbi:MAG: NADH-quinone oxidoreductase subunit L, partial [Fimbriimonadaceae bacterium]|nr:NADH-quinone oxidoreductase subunit L [Chitinophagales bacterium]